LKCASEKTPQEGRLPEVQKGKKREGEKHSKKTHVEKQEERRWWQPVKAVRKPNVTKTDCKDEDPIRRRIRRKACTGQMMERPSGKGMGGFGF